MVVNASDELMADEAARPMKTAGDFIVRRACGGLLWLSGTKWRWCVRRKVMGAVMAGVPCVWRRGGVWRRRGGELRPSVNRKGLRGADGQTTMKFTCFYY